MCTQLLKGGKPEKLYFLVYCTGEYSCWILSGSYEYINCDILYEMLETVIQLDIFP